MKRKRPFHLPSHDSCSGQHPALTPEPQCSQAEAGCLAGHPAATEHPEQLPSHCWSLLPSPTQLASHHPEDGIFTHPCESLKVKWGVAVICTFKDRSFKYADLKSEQSIFLSHKTSISLLLGLQQVRTERCLILCRGQS